MTSESKRRIPKAAAITLRLAIVTLFALTLTGAGRINKDIYGKNQKAHYAADDVLGFVSPGFNIAINSASIAATGTITAVVTLTDTAGLPLDVNGITTPGVVAMSLGMDYIPANGEQYVPYVTSAGTTRPTFENAITLNFAGASLTSLGNGQYQYVFGTKAPAGYDQTASHRLGVYGSRTLAPFNLPNEFASAHYDFVPNGSKVTKVRDVVATKACDNCHDQLSEHGGTRRGVELCVMCHTPALVDTASGNSVDFKVYIHKIHMGSSLPSVQGGKPYAFSATSDWSTVIYPADVRRCETCHDPKLATQANLYNTNPTAEACGSCHDDVNFASGVNHAGGPQPDNSMCAQCHIPQGELEFDASIKGAHTIPTDSSYLQGWIVNLGAVANNKAGQAPTIKFTMTDKNGTPMAFPTASAGSLSLTMAGPTTDYGYTSFGAASATTPGYVTESVPATACDSNGNCSYTFTNPIPAKATGTYAIGVEARRTDTVLAGTTSAQSVAFGAINKVTYFSVDGSPVAPRRTVVAEANCNRCHVELSLHGGLRNQVEYCVLCHNPSNSDFTTRPTAVVKAQQSLPNQGIAFDLLAHRIHTGMNLPTIAAGQSNQDYFVVGHSGSTNDFSNAYASVPASIPNTGVRYPAMDPTGAVHVTANCEMCHVGPNAIVTAAVGSETTLPLGKNAVTDPQGPIPSDPAITAACTGCHAAISTASHALANTTSLGESCIACHGASADYNSLGLDYSVSKVHAQY